jgi:hypothetical protein
MGCVRGPDSHQRAHTLGGRDRQEECRGDGSSVQSFLCTRRQRLDLPRASHRAAPAWPGQRPGPLGRFFQLHTRLGFMHHTPGFPPGTRAAPLRHLARSRIADGTSPQAPPVGPCSGVHQALSTRQRGDSPSQGVAPGGAERRLDPTSRGGDEGHESCYAPSRTSQGVVLQKCLGRGSHCTRLSRDELLKPHGDTAWGDPVIVVTAQLCCTLTTLRNGCRPP